MIKFNLKSGDHRLVVNTVSIGVPVTASGDDPGPPAPDQVDIEGTMLNPNMFDYQMPTQETPDSSWSVSPLSILLPGEIDYDNPPTDDGSPPPAIDGDFVYGRDPVIDVGAGLYSDADELELYVTTVNPTDIVSTIAYSDTSSLMLIATDCSLSELGPATYSPVSVVSFESCHLFDDHLEWYRPEEYGWYLMKLDVQSRGYFDSGGGDWWWKTIGGPVMQNDAQFCRYNPPIGGYSPPVAGTFDDALWQDPGAVLNRVDSLTTAHPLAPPSDYLWWWVQFRKGGPSDFPAGQRLRCLTTTEHANGAATGSSGISKVGDGLYKLSVRFRADWDSTPPYPWPATVPWPVDGSIYGETDGGVQDTNLFKLYFKIRFTKV